MSETKDPYKILGVSRGAGREEIKKAYYRMARKYHPDQHLGNAYAEEMFKDVASAYEVLSDDALRARYDQVRGYAARQAPRNPDPWSAGGAEPSQATIDAILGLFAEREAAYRAERWRPDLTVKGQKSRKRWLWLLAAVAGLLVFSIIMLWGTLSMKTALPGRTQASRSIPLKDGDYSAVVATAKVVPAASTPGQPHGVVELEVLEGGTTWLIANVEKPLPLGASSQSPWYEFCTLQSRTRLVVTIHDGEVTAYRLQQR